MKTYMSTFDPLFDQLIFGNKAFGSKKMPTNIKELEDRYVLSIELPDVSKEDLKVSLKDGYLTVKATVKEEADEEATYLLKERTVGEYSRNYYVGEEVKLSDISAKLNNGILTLTVMKVKEEEKPEEEFIEIE